MAKRTKTTNDRSGSGAKSGAAAVDYSNVLKLQKKREALLEKREMLEKNALRLSSRNSRINFENRALKARLENLGNRLRGKLSELNLLEERLLILEKNPVDAALAETMEQLQKGQKDFRNISVEMVTVSRKINDLRKEMNTPRAADRPGKDAERAEAAKEGPSHRLKDDLRKLLEKETRDLMKKLKAATMQNAVLKGKQEALLDAAAALGMNRHKEENQANIFYIYKRED
ncbi:MAG: hypothetical protein OEU95_01540 [Nitrospirota bacterium]|nr:hypothetical protein [Nitrospirota bacterium]